MKIFLGEYAPVALCMSGERGGGSVSYLAKLVRESVLHINDKRTGLNRIFFLMFSIQSVANGSQQHDAKWHVLAKRLRHKGRFDAAQPMKQTVKHSFSQMKCR